MSKADDRRLRALARLEARLEARLAPVLTVPLTGQQAQIWREVIALRRKLGRLTDQHLAIERALR